ncbi:MAG: helix-turn-helix domain-containing protein [Candidatus Dojkabacteria bacterium]|nr:helix-turn-helix domain-containing protein [Candidatus Dojkabacteria bacterium]
MESIKQLFKKMNTIGDDTILEKLGLDKKEIKIYLHLVNSGVQSIKQVADETSVNRTTVYRYLESLSNKDLVEWIISERGKKVQATPPNNIRLFLSEKKQKLEELERALPSFISQLDTVRPVEKFATQIRYYKGEDGIRQMIWNTLKTKGPLLSFTPFGRRLIINPKFEDNFEREWTRRGLSDKIITNETKLDYVKKQLVPNYKQTLKIRVINSDKYRITNDIAIYNDIIAISSFDKNDLVGVEIENKEMANSLKSIFDIVWEVAKPLKQL